MIRMFFRCNSGHYFQDLVCPWDGWSHPGFAKALEIAKNIQEKGTILTISQLKSNGIDINVLRRVVLIDFGDPKAEFTGLYPHQLLVQGKIYDLINLDKNFK